MCWLTVSSASCNYVNYRLNAGNVNNIKIQNFISK